MSDNAPPHDKKSDGKLPPETLELRARPQPVTRINRKMLIGSAALLLIGIAGIVLVALSPPSLKLINPQDVYTVDRKPISDGLWRLPATYDGIGLRPAEGASPPAARPLASGVTQLAAPSADPAAESERTEKARLARLAGQAREAPLFFRLQFKSPSRDAPTPGSTPAAGSSIQFDPVNSSAAAVTALRATAQVRASASNDAGTLATDATDQARRLEFLKAGPEKDIYNPHGLQTPASPHQLLAGTIISASLVSGLNSDLPGLVIAQVTENTFDSVTGRTLLIPQGSRLLGRYDSVVAFGQERALVVWQRIILPDGSSVVIDNLPATDTSGYAGLADELDLHTWQLLKGVVIATVLGIGNSLAFGDTDSDLVKALRESTGQTTNRAGQRLVEKNLNVSPTITVRPGWPLRIIVHKDLVLRPYRVPGSN